MTDANLPITVRKMGFDFDEEFEPLSMGSPAQAYFIIGLSLYLPYLEPFLIKALRQAAEDISDPAVAADLDGFCRQEAQHYKQHERFNATVHARGYPGLAEIEAECKAEFDDFLANRSKKFCVGFVEGFESYTTQGATAALNSGALDAAAERSEFANLFRWHLTEEIEHRTVAFDIWEDLYGPDYFYRVKMCWTAQMHVFRFIWRTSKLMSAVDTERHGEAYRLGPLGRSASTVLAFAQFLKTYMPWYSPYKLRVSPKIHELAAQYTRAAGA